MNRRSFLSAALLPMIPDLPQAAGAVVIAQPTRIGELRLMLLQAERATFTGCRIVCHPTDWMAIALKKDSAGRFVFDNPGRPPLWGRSA